MSDKYTIEFAEPTLTAQGIVNAIEEYMGHKPVNVIVSSVPDVATGKAYGKEPVEEDEPKATLAVSGRDVPLTLNELLGLELPVRSGYIQFRRGGSNQWWVSQTTGNEYTSQILHAQFSPLYLDDES